jgi:ketosteroid isomerase-like protein
MSEEKIENCIRGWREAIEKADVEKALSFVAEDAVWVNNEGTFRGKEEWKRCLTWMTGANRDWRFKDAGIGIMVKGNKAVSQFTIEAKPHNHVKYEVPSVSLYVSKNEKIQQHWSLSDRLSIAKQSGEGIVAERVIRTVVNGMEKGLH